MRTLLVIVAFGALVAAAAPVGAAAMFAAPAFERQWRADVERVADYWGPLTAARDGETEAYRGAPGDRRLVQYFDKGRMESGGAETPLVTIGRLAAEMVAGQIDTGAGTFQALPPPAVEIAGDRGCACLTFAALAASRAALDPAPPRPRAPIALALRPDGGAVAPPLPPAPTDATSVIAYDDATRHNVAAVFAQYRRDLGVETIGLAVSEPFFTAITANGAQRTVIAQVFERRVLTYTATNPESRRVESSSIGPQYHAWRYPTP